MHVKELQSSPGHCEKDVPHRLHGQRGLVVCCLHALISVAHDRRRVTDLWNCSTKVEQKELPRAFILALYNCPSKQDGVVVGVDGCKITGLEISFLKVSSMKGRQRRSASRPVLGWMNSRWRRRVPS